MNDEEIGSLPAAVGVLVLAALFGGIVLAIYPGWDSIWGFLKTNLLLTEQAPAWVQAIGSILAIVAAGYFPYVHWHYIKKAESFERKRRAAYVYISLRNQILTYRFFVSNLVSKYRKLNVATAVFEKDADPADIAAVFMDGFLLPAIDSSQYSELDYLSSSEAMALASAISRGGVTRLFLEREGKYAEAGETDGIVRALAFFDENADQTLIDLHRITRVMDQRCLDLGITVAY